MRFIISLLLTGLVISIACFVVPGAQVDGFGWAIITGLVIGFVNASIGSLMRLLTFPLNWISFGLVSFIITILAVMLSDKLMGSKFNVEGFWSAAMFAVIVAIIEMIMGNMKGEKK